jgi:ketosteroid isomerase-like protein
VGGNTLRIQLGGFMSESDSTTAPAAILRRLQDATNAHDIEAIVACFAPDYRNETPVHPARGFIGREQVRRNWTQILTAVPDLSADVVASAVSEDVVWSEWEHRGTRPDGTTHLMRGVIIFTVGDGVITSARFFLEPVDEGDTGVDAAVLRQVRPGSAP